ncbi:hypothetical protein C0Q70_16065 [Pomacea canaliculata]|uniref:F-box domain-containing protein n=2 Tax=Pomacea canaliculata TaxID=400727 RepID=A0A2T7NNR1_POMCA|nr:hypothetical protein C0Q70_16065 [Pomacea canaliculata]
MYSRTSESQVVSGGLQQYITNKLKRKDDRSLTDRLKALYLRDDTVQFNLRGTEVDQAAMFDCLPINVKLHIFSFLDAHSLCLACGVCKSWNQMLWDESLWRHRLEVDKHTWSQVTHCTNPEVYQEASSEWTYKEIYLRCSPDVIKSQRGTNSTFHQVSTVLKYLLPKKVPKAAMFGPGLETSTSGIVRKMLYENNDNFTRIAMFPGQFEGVGAGMTLKLSDGHQFHLSVLYSASKHERENQHQQNRLARNRMLSQQQGAEASDAVTYELQPALQQLCHTLDAFVFVVDASESLEAVSAGKAELRAMVQERWASPRVPVLVLSCVPTANSSRIPAVDVMLALELSSFTRPWMVIDCVTENLRSVDTGIVWMIEMTQQK